MIRTYMLTLCELNFYILLLAGYSKEGTPADTHCRLSKVYIFIQTLEDIEYYWEFLKKPLI